MDRNLDKIIEKDNVTELVGTEEKMDYHQVELSMDSDSLRSVGEGLREAGNNEIPTDMIGAFQAGERDRLSVSPPMSPNAQPDSPQGDQEALAYMTQTMTSMSMTHLVTLENPIYASSPVLDNTQSRPESDSILEYLKRLDQRFDEQKQSMQELLKDQNKRFDTFEQRFSSLEQSQNQRFDTFASELGQIKGNLEQQLASLTQKVDQVAEQYVTLRDNFVEERKEYQAKQNLIEAKLTDISIQQQAIQGEHNRVVVSITKLEEEVVVIKSVNETLPKEIMSVSQEIANLKINQNKLEQEATISNLVTTLITSPQNNHGVRTENVCEKLPQHVDSQLEVVLCQSQPPLVLENSITNVDRLGTFLGSENNAISGETILLKQTESGKHEFMTDATHQNIVANAQDLLDTSNDQLITHNVQEQEPVISHKYSEKHLLIQQIVVITKQLQALRNFADGNNTQVHVRNRRKTCYTSYFEQDKHYVRYFCDKVATLEAKLYMNTQKCTRCFNLTATENILFSNYTHLLRCEMHESDDLFCTDMKLEAVAFDKTRNFSLYYCKQWIKDRIFCEPNNNFSLRTKYATISCYDQRRHIKASHRCYTLDCDAIQLTQTFDRILSQTKHIGRRRSFSYANKACLLLADFSPGNLDFVV